MREGGRRNSVGGAIAGVFQPGEISLVSRRSKLGEL